MNRVLMWILGAAGLVLAVLFLAYKSRPTVITSGVAGTASTTGTASSQPTNGTAQVITAAGSAITGTLGALGNLFK